MLCRVCEKHFSGGIIHQLGDMPAYAQHLSSEPCNKTTTLDIRQCPYCGVVQLHGTPVYYYKDVIRFPVVSNRMMSFREKQFKDFISRNVKKNDIGIEIGCGKGEYLSILRGIYPVIFGLENSGNPAWGIYSGYIDKANYIIDPKYSPVFDFFFCFSFMEHWPWPNKVLAGLNNNLKPGAVGIIEVPNFDMILKQSLISEFMLDHLVYYTEDTLKFILQKNGFDVISCKPIWDDYILSVEVRKRLPLKINISYMEDLKSDIFNFIKRSKRTVIWGAGHQAFASVCLYDLKDKIAYIVDSSVAKQNKYAPTTSLIIRAPETLTEDSEVDSIIVIAGGYSDSIVEKIKKGYPGIKHISVIRQTCLEEIKG